MLLVRYRSKPKVQLNLPCSARQRNRAAQGADVDHDKFHHPLAQLSAILVSISGPSSQFASLLVDLAVRRLFKTVPALASFYLWRVRDRKVNSTYSTCPPIFGTDSFSSFAILPSQLRFASKCQSAGSCSPVGTTSIRHGHFDSSFLTMRPLHSGCSDAVSTRVHLA